MLSFDFVVLYCILGINIIVNSFICLYFLNARAESTIQEQLLEDSVAVLQRNNCPFSPFLVPGLSSPIYKEYHRTFIQERDRDMSGDQGYGSEYNLFSCLSRLAITVLLQCSVKF